MRRRVVLFVLMTATAAPAWAQWSAFLPRPFKSGAYLDLFGADERDNTENGPHRFQWTDGFTQEKLTLFSNGYVYHPRFVVYQASVAGLLKQESYRSPLLASGWRHRSGVEYDA